MMIIVTKALLTLEVSIEQASEIRFVSHCNYSMGSGRNWEQNMLKVSKLSVEKGSLC